MSRMRATYDIMNNISDGCVSLATVQRLQVTKATCYPVQGSLSWQVHQAQLRRSISYSLGRSKISPFHASGNVFFRAGSIEESETVGIRDRTGRLFG